MLARDLNLAKAQLKEHGWTKIESILSKQEPSLILHRLWKAKDDAEVLGEDAHNPFLDPNPQNVRVFFLMEVDHSLS